METRSIKLLSLLDREMNFYYIYVSEKNQLYLIMHVGWIACNTDRIIFNAGNPSIFVEGIPACVVQLASPVSVYLEVFEVGCSKVALLIDESESSYSCDLYGDVLLAFLI